MGVLVKLAFSLAFAAMFASFQADRAQAETDQEQARNLFVSALENLDQRLNGQAHVELMQACDLGHAEACHRAGEMSAAGNGISGRVDQSDAKRYFGKSCEGGNVLGCHRYAFYFSKQFSEMPKAAAIYEENCERGHGPSCFERAALERHLEDSEALQRSYYELGCSYEDRDSCYEFASALKDGTGGNVDEAQSRVVFEKACDLEHADGCYSLMMMQVMGKGGPADMDAARETEKRRCALPGVSC